MTWCQVFYNRILTNSHLPHNRGHGFERSNPTGVSQLSPSQAHDPRSRNSKVGRPEYSRNPVLKLNRTKVRLIQQILPACRHPDSSRAYLGLRTRPDGRFYGWIPNTSGCPKAAPQNPRLGPTPSALAPPAM